MVVVGLTGGIGSGKSTVATLLAERGAHLIDADQVARDVVEPGQPALAALVERFGAGILDADGRLDRAALAGVAFADDDARRALNGITHPAIGAEMLRRLGTARDADPEAVVVMDIPLLAEGGRDRYALQGVIVVDTPVDVAIDRLVRLRGFTESDARAHVDVQATHEDRRAIADVVIDNGGDVDALPVQVDAAWTWATSLPHT